MREVLTAAQQGNKKVLQEAIAKGKVGVVDEEATTPLMYAAASGREEILRVILEKEVRRDLFGKNSHVLNYIISIFFSVLFIFFLLLSSGSKSGGIY